jgi:hypothetical protein
MLKETISELDTRLANIKLILRSVGVIPGPNGNVLQGKGWDVEVYCKIGELKNVRGFRIEEKAEAFSLFEDYAHILRESDK